MRAIDRVQQFRKDYKREARGKYRATLDNDLVELLELLANDVELPERFVDHGLGGQWKGHRDCHIHPDLVLIYRKPGGDTLQLVRLRSHSELSL